MSASEIEHLLDRFEEEIVSREAARSIGDRRDIRELEAARRALVDRDSMWALRVERLKAERDGTVSSPYAQLADIDYATERAAILATSVGIARMRLEDGNPVAARAELDQAAQKTHDLLRSSLIASGADPERVDMFIGRRP